MEAAVGLWNAPHPGAFMHNTTLKPAFAYRSVFLPLLLVRTPCYYQPLPTTYGHLPHDTPLYLCSFRPHLKLRTPPSRISATDTFSNASFLCLQVYQNFPNHDKLHPKGTNSFFISCRHLQLPYQSSETSVTPNHSNDHVAVNLATHYKPSSSSSSTSACKPRTYRTFA